MASIQVYMLGRFLVAVDGQPLSEGAWTREKACQLFKLLLSRPGRRLSREEAIQLLWPDCGPGAVDARLRATLQAVRVAFRGDSADDRAIVVDADRDSIGVRANVDMWVDADAFEHALAQARRTDDPLPWLTEADT